MLQQEIEALLARKDLRSADRAYMKTMLTKLKKGKRLDPREQDVLWTFITRYRGPLEVNI